MVYGIKDKKTLNEIDKMLIKAIRLFNDAATVVEDIRSDLKTNSVREKTLNIMKITSRQQEKLEGMRDKVYNALKQHTKDKPKSKPKSKPLESKMALRDKKDLIRILKQIDNEDNEEDTWVKFKMENEKYELLIPSYGMTWRLFDFPYKNNKTKHRRKKNKKSIIIKFIEYQTDDKKVSFGIYGKK